MNASTKALLTALAAIGLVATAMAAGGFASNHTGGEASAETQNTSFVRVVHLSPNAPTVDVYVDNESVMSNVSFGDVGDYLALEAGEHTVTVTEPGDRDAVALETNVTLEPRTVTTFAAGGEVGEEVEHEFDLHNLSDDAWTPGDDEAALRVVHLSPDADTVHVRITSADEAAMTGTATAIETATTETATETTTTAMATGTPAAENELLFEDLVFGNHTEYVSLPPGEYTVEIIEVAGDGTGLVLATANVTVEGGQAYTAWASGNLVTDDLEAELGVTLTQDGTLTFQRPADGNETAIGTETETATGTETETATGTETETATGTETETESG